MNRFALLFLASVSMLNGACETQPVKDENSRFYSVPLGSQFTLNRDITIPGDQTSVYLQYGKVLGSGGVDFYKPHCKFELYTISTHTRIVKTDTFTVIRIVDRLEDVSTSWPVYAALGLGVGLSYRDGPTHLTYSTAMYLESNVQPDVFRMDCKRWDDPAIGEYLSIREMRDALGDYFTLNLAD